MNSQERLLIDMVRELIPQEMWKHVCTNFSQDFPNAVRENPTDHIPASVFVAAIADRQPTADGKSERVMSVIEPLTELMIDRSDPSVYFLQGIVASTQTSRTVYAFFTISEGWTLRLRADSVEDMEEARRVWAESGQRIREHPDAVETLTMCGKTVDGRIFFANYRLHRDENNIVSLELEQTEFIDEHSESQVRNLVLDTFMEGFLGAKYEVSPLFKLIIERYQNFTEEEEWSAADLPEWEEGEDKKLVGFVEALLGGNRGD